MKRTNEPGRGKSHERGGGSGEYGVKRRRTERARKGESESRGALAGWGWVLDIRISSEMPRRSVGLLKRARAPRGEPSRIFINISRAASAHIRSRINPLVRFLFFSLSATRNAGYVPSFTFPSTLHTVTYTDSHGFASQN